MEDHPEDPDNQGNANLFATKLDSLCNDFKLTYCRILSFYDEEADLEQQQEVLDNHDDVVSNLILRLNKIVSKGSTMSKTNHPRGSITLKLARIRSGLDSTEKDINRLEAGEEDGSLAKQNQERLVEHKSQLNDIYDKLASLNIEDNDLLTEHAELETRHFSYARELKAVLTFN